MKNIFFEFFVICLFFAGCDTSVDLEEKLDVELPDSIFYADTICENGGCENGDMLQLSIALDAAEAAPENDSIQFVQYRVVYQVPDVSGVIPYFAAPIDLTLQNGDTQTLLLKTVGNAQKTFVFDRVGGNQVTGVARVTLAGYDEMDNTIFYHFDFRIAFGDFESAATGALKSQEEQ